MCGIAALFNIKSGMATDHIRRMVDIVSHRGPDDEGFVLLKSASPEYVTFFGGNSTPQECYRSSVPYAPAAEIHTNNDETVDIALGHRRLSIIDLYPSGHQPMCSEDRRYFIVYNGEIYNYLEVRGELVDRGYRFLSRSDTEIILHSYREWGTECLHRFNGMFAFVLFDRTKGYVFAARDRFGVKPLYYWISPNGVLAFASEIKQFSVLNGWRARLNAQRAYDFLCWGLTDHTPETLFQGVRQLRGGEYLECKVADRAGTLKVRRWYALNPTPYEGDFNQAAERFRELFYDSVRLRLRADVPVGTGLSGGLDSSSIVCVVNDLLTNEGVSEVQNTFSSCSNISRFDEREYIDEVVRHTGVNAHYTYPPVDELFCDLEDLTWHHDEPFSSTSVYAEWRVFKTVAETPVKVTLDGHGADELLAGYHTFFGPHFAYLLRTFRWTKLLKEVQAAQQLHGYGYGFAATRMLNIFLPEIVRQPVKRLAGKTAAKVDWLNAKPLMIEEVDPQAAWGEKISDLNRFSLAQLLYTSMPAQLRWCDRDSMAHSIESRAPYLDYRLVEFTLGCPAEYKLSSGTTKRIFREAMRDILPEKIRNRMDKMGFVTPEEIWVRNQATEQFRGAVREAVEQSRGVLNVNTIARAERIINGEEEFNFFIWRIISFGNWMDQFEVEPIFLR